MRWLCVFLFSLRLVAAEELSPLIFIHFGSEFPDHLETALYQARLFNKDCPFYILGSAQAIQKKEDFVDKYQVTFVDYTTLPKSELYKHFILFKKPRSQKALKKLDYRTGMYSAERYFLLYEFMKKFELKDVVYIENDIMLYTDIQSLMPILKKHYQNMAVTFDSSYRGIASFFYIASAASILPLNQVTSYWYNKWRCPDFICLMKCYKDYGKDVIAHLPILPPDYASTKGLRDPIHKYAINFQLIQLSTELVADESYSQLYDAFHSLFDAAALGQFFGGTPDGCPSGFRNPHCVFDPMDFKYSWEKDNQNRWVPYLHYLDKKYRVNNLHVHVKELEPFLSDNDEIRWPMQNRIL